MPKVRYVRSSAMRQAYAEEELWNWESYSVFQLWSLLEGLHRAIKPSAVKMKGISNLTIPGEFQKNLFKLEKPLPMFSRTLFFLDI